jgi:hypothetical protein
MSSASSSAASCTRTGASVRRTERRSTRLARIWHGPPKPAPKIAFELRKRSLTRFGGQITDSAKVGLATELRYREKVMATTWSSRQDARIRYTAPAVADGRLTSVTEIDLYRSLEETLGPV